MYPGTLAEQFRLALATRPHVLEAFCGAAADRDHVIAAGENRQLSDVQFIGARFDHVQHREQGVAILLDFRPLVAEPGVLDGQGMQAEGPLHLFQLFGVRILKRDPHEAVRKGQVFLYAPNVDIAEFVPVLIGRAADEHGRILRWSLATWNAVE